MQSDKLEPRTTVLSLLPRSQNEARSSQVAFTPLLKKSLSFQLKIPLGRHDNTSGIHLCTTHSSHSSTLLLRCQIIPRPAKNHINLYSLVLYAVSPPLRRHPSKSFTNARAPGVDQTFYNPA